MDIRCTTIPMTLLPVTHRCAHSLRGCRLSELPSVFPLCPASQGLTYRRPGSHGLLQVSYDLDVFWAAPCYRAALNRLGRMSVVLMRESERVPRAKLRGT